MEHLHVLVMPSNVDEPLLHSLLSSLKEEGIPTVVGPDVGGYPSYAEQHDAAVLLLVVGQAGLPPILPYPVDTLVKNYQVVAVTLGEQSGSTSIPGDIYRIDLGGSIIAQSSTFQRLVGHLRALIRSGFRLEDRGIELEQQVSQTLASVERLKTLTTEMGDLHTVLSAEQAQSSGLREILGEINRTYEVVQEAIETFRVAGLTLERSDGEAFAGLAGGFLQKHIHNGRAHCTWIGSRYKRTGGLRDEVKAKLSPQALQSLDETFDDLANSDIDVFSVMDDLGNRLTMESRAIVRLLLTDRKEDARKQVALASERLAPLEQALDDALLAFQTIQSSLGYAEPAPQKKEEVHVTHQTITIYGDVVNSNVVAATTIENSFNKLAKSKVEDDLMTALTALHKATAELTTHLQNDEAERAARDLEELAAEATSTSPRRAFWKRAADGLVAAAETVAKVGIPVIELVTKITTMLGAS